MKQVGQVADLSGSFAHAAPEVRNLNQEGVLRMRWQISETVMDRRKALVGFGLVALAPLGCLGKNLTANKPAEVAAAPPAPVFTPPPSAAPTPQGRLTCTWSKKVSYAPDTSHGGMEMTGLVCRMYVFGPDVAKPYFGDGNLIVDLYDSTQRGPNSEPVLTDELRLNPDALRQMAKTDGMFGDGYTIFMPWTHYSLDVKQVFINMLYTSAKGEKLSCNSGQFVIDHSETVERMKRGYPLSKNPVNLPVIGDDAPLVH
jgi:hypothetical protein